MRVVIPYDPVTPKTRLADLLSLSERQTLARSMLLDVLTAVGAAGHDAIVLSTEQVDVPTNVVVDDRPLSTAVNEVIADSDLPVGVLMADLPLLTAETVRRLVTCPNDVVIAPGLGGGTNGLVVRKEGFTVDYHGSSYLNHVNTARGAGLTVNPIDSYRLAVDVDEPGDLTEVLLHSDGHTSEWLRETNFELDSSGERIRANRQIASRPD